MSLVVGCSLLAADCSAVGQVLRAASWSVSCTPVFVVPVSVKALAFSSITSRGVHGGQEVSFLLWLQWAHSKMFSGTAISLALTGVSVIAAHGVWVFALAVTFGSGYLAIAVCKYFFVNS